MTARARRSSVRDRIASGLACSVLTPVEAELGAGMGAKTAILAFADGDIRPALLGAATQDPVAAARLVGQVFPGYQVTPAGHTTLGDGVYPADDVTNVTVLPGLELLCDRRLVLDLPSQLPAHLAEFGAGRRIVMHGMHSVVDWLCFAVWEDGRLIRSLSLSPDGGIVEDIGDPFEFERPFWAGEHPVEPVPGWPSQGPYPLPFHPLELGEEALRALFGFVLEGYPDPADIDDWEIPLQGFRVADPSGEEQAARAAEYEAARQSGANRGSSGWVRTVSCMKWISTTSSDCGDGLIAGSTVRRRALPLRSRRWRLPASPAARRKLAGRS